MKPGYVNVDFAKTEYHQEEADAVNRVLCNPNRWLASGPENEAFEKEFARYVGTKYAVCVNSGSSANLIALNALGLRKGSRVLTSACGFPATLSPILHLGLRPVLVDYDISTHNIDVKACLKELKSKDIKAVIFAHTMGNPVEMDEILEVCHRKKIIVIEDCCEAVGSSYRGVSVGSFGDIGTFSFYPAHQITAMGGGGMIVTSDRELMCRMKSLRDWGKRWDWRDELGDWKTNFTTNVGGITYYRGYTYTSVGYNAKLPEANCAFGRIQLTRLKKFTEKRIQNFNYLKGLFKNEDVRIPQSSKYSTPSWFGFVITLKKGNRNRLAEHFEKNGIRTRPFFAGNITRHEPFKKYKGFFPVADFLMTNSMFVGCWQGLGKRHFDHIYKTYKAFK